MSNTRLDELNQWLDSLPSSLELDRTSLQPASSDASFRRYFRILTGQANYPSLIIMDAPTDQEDTRPFVKIGHLLAAANICVPEILHINQDHGFLLLSDLGNTTYLSALNQDSANGLYLAANQSLIQMQTAVNTSALAPYDATLLNRELDLFPHWYLGQHLNYSLTPAQSQSLATIFKALNDNILAQPQVFVHRDFHSRNLMVTPTHQPGVLDFQDAVKGAITYDLVSLYRDAYIRWEEEQQVDWVIRYWELARKAHLPVHADFGDFYRDFEWMGLQRHLKVLGIFARLYHRDGKDGYLKDLPLVLEYTEKVAQRYVAFKPLVRILDAAKKFERPSGLTF